MAYVTLLDILYNLNSNLFPAHIDLDHLHAVHMMYLKSCVICHVAAHIMIFISILNNHT